MYTQCPDCNTAFRVTAEVLKQAAGQVRCGGCGNAFNALEYLSESMPEQPQARETDTPLPELTPEPRDPTENKPQAISAEQSAALLKTLDELAGSDIRIEDTGVEWRVLDDDALDIDSIGLDTPADAGVDELLEESPTPVDQFLTNTPNDIDASEIFEESANAPAKTPVEELRFDDNTPLPDDFNLDDESSYVAESSGTKTSDDEASEGDEKSAHPRDVDDAPVDIALGDPDEWADILGEFVEPHEPYVHPLDAELAALEAPSSDDNGDNEYVAREDSETPPDVDTQFALQAEAMGIDLSGVHARSADTEHESAPEDDVDERAVVVESQADDEPTPAVEPEPDDEAAIESEADDEIELSLQESSEESELELMDDTGEEPESERSADTGEAAELEPTDETGEELEPELTEDTGEEPEPEVTEDTGEEPEPELTEDTGEESEPELTEDTGEESEPELTEDTGEEPEPESTDDRIAELPPSDEPDQDPETSLDHDAEEEATRNYPMDEDESEDESGEADHAPLEFGSIEKDMAELEERSNVFDEEFFDDGEGESDGNIETGASIDDEVAELEDEASSDEQPDHIVPEPTEEEQTLNRLIDQELLSMAVEDEDGFASTIVVDENEAREALAHGGESQAYDEDGVGFESIVMEGESVRSALDQEKRIADMAAAAKLAAEADKAEAADTEDINPVRNRRMAAAAGFLALLLVVQVLHQSREALATIPVFNDTVGPLYRAIGMPLSPAWDIRGFDFEATQPAPNEDGSGRQQIYSRVANTSDKALPYPLINVALVDRFEETIGSNTQDPGEYLPVGQDPGELVEPGKTFNAVISVPSPAEGVTGYRLRLCYRLSNGMLSCKNSDFK
ncbi:MAG: DUF3426 domain-containing protein [Woeseiaceae bacterium]